MGKGSFADAREKWWEGTLFLPEEMPFLLQLHVGHSGVYWLDAFFGLSLRTQLLKY